MMNLGTFFSYIFLSAYTPGPNNIMAMANAGNYGFKKGMKFCVGVLFGFFSIMVCSALFCSVLYQFIPKIEPVMVCIGAGYILWLAWTVFRDKPHEGKKSSFKTNSIFSGMVLQFINVKVILYGITAFSTFILPCYQSIPMLFLFVLLLSLVGFSGTVCWALFGAVFDRFFSAHRKGLNTVMALLLLYCAVTQIAGLFR